MTTYVTQLVDAMIDRATSEEPNGRFAVTLSHENALLLAHQPLPGWAIDASAHGSQSYREAIVWPMDASKIGETIVLMPVHLNRGEERLGTTLVGSLADGQILPTVAPSAAIWDPYSI